MRGPEVATLTGVRRLAIFALLGGGCYEGVPASGHDSDGAGESSGGAGEGSEGTASDTSSDDPPATFGRSPTRRMAAFEYENTLRALFGDAAVDAAAPALATLPSDRTEELPFSTMAHGVTATHVEAYWRVADMVASFVAADAGRRGDLHACLGEAAPTDTCVRSFVEAFGAIAWRRPLDDAEIDALVASFTAAKTVSVEDGVAIVLVELLVAPEFLYRPELGGAPEGDALRLTEYELATRLSYLAWGAPPDAALRAKLEDGELSDDELSEEIDRVFADPRAVAHVQRFVEQWLDVDRLPSVQQPEAFLDGIDPSMLAEDMRDEIDAFVHAEVFERESEWAELFTSRRAEIGSPELAAVYGLSPQDIGEVELPAPRAGLLGRAALLLQSGESTHPVKRGAFVARELLCTTIELPDPEAFPPDAIEPPPFDPTKTARERWTDQTSANGCAACHALINPYGFALEEFDTIGRARALEPVLDPQTGEVAAELPIDANVPVLVDGAQVNVEGAAGLGAALVDSETARACLARQWLRFSLGREDEDDDEPLLDAMTAELEDTESSVLAMLERIARAPAFRFRRLPE